jgi:hypothetical protein
MTDDTKWQRYELGWWRRLGPVVQSIGIPDGRDPNEMTEDEIGAVMGDVPPENKIAYRVE